ncbi:MAG TPA: hypothetical protein VLX59_02950 [Acidimicrobiales bacterium]|nr:hypothetical protein [Acidimicrobiales bacterium]
MHPWMLEQVASEHRRDLLGQASRWRFLHRQVAGSPHIRLRVSMGRLGLIRRRKPVPSVAAAVPAGSPTSATYAC